VTYVFYDLVIGVVLLLFALRGRKRGLILTLCSLLAIITAFIGASYAADELTPKAADFMAPKISSIIERRLEKSFNQDGSSKDASSDSTKSAGDDAASADDGNETVQTSGGTGEESQDADASGSGLDKIKEAIHVLGLPSGMLDSVKDSLGDLDVIGDIPSAISNAIARAAAETVLHILIFLIAFVLILLFWTVVGHALDLVAKLPVLHFFNKTGGFVFGLCKGALFLFVLAWILQYLGGVIPDDAVEHTYLLHFFMTKSPLSILSSI
jgi:uncharacterized membrane protein required for colicin V production